MLGLLRRPNLRKIVAFGIGQKHFHSLEAHPATASLVLSSEMVGAMVVAKAIRRPGKAVMAVGHQCG